MKCEKCGEIITYKDGVNKNGDSFITLKCKCRCVLHWGNGSIKIIPIKEYRKQDDTN